MGKSKVRQTQMDADIEAVRALFLEYAESLGFSLCFQGFDQELAALPGCYAPPAGRLLLALVDGQPVGCVGLRGLDEEGVCEMKRLYVRPIARGLGLGWDLASTAVDAAREIGYRTMRLDTLSSMVSADAVYRGLGFIPIEAYYHNPHPEVRYFELDLESL